MKKKTIIIGMPQDVGIYKHIIKNLDALNFEVIDISFNANKNFIYPSFYHKIYNFLKKFFFNDNSYKKSLRLRNEKPKIYDTLNNLSDIDYALFIRPDIYPKKILKKIKKKTTKTIGYQWDGISVYPDVKSYFNFFDSFFVFDKSDVTSRLQPLTNFYFDYEYNEPITNDNSIYFIGSYFKNRISILEKISVIAKKVDLTNNISICLHSKKIPDNNQKNLINYTNKIISFEENLKNSRKAKVLVDILNDAHTGLSFRIFESLGYDKKLITNNSSIKTYDIYNPNNIFVIENENLEGLEDFLQKEYIVNNQLKEKYSFTNWIKYILDIKGHIPLNQ